MAQKNRHKVLDTSLDDQRPSRSPTVKRKKSPQKRYKSHTSTDDSDSSIDRGRSIEKVKKKSAGGKKNLADRRRSKGSPDRYALSERDHIRQEKLKAQKLLKSPIAEKKVKKRQLSPPEVSQKQVRKRQESPEYEAPRPRQKKRSLSPMEEKGGHSKRSVERQARTKRSLSPKESLGFKGRRVTPDIGRSRTPEGYSRGRSPEGHSRGRSPEASKSRKAYQEEQRSKRLVSPGPPPKSEPRGRKQISPEVRQKKGKKGEARKITPEPPRRQARSPEGSRDSKRISPTLSSERSRRRGPSPEADPRDQRTRGRDTRDEREREKERTERERDRGERTKGEREKGDRDRSRGGRQVPSPEQYERGKRTGSPRKGRGESPDVAPVGLSPGDQRDQRHRRQQQAPEEGHGRRHTSLDRAVSKDRRAQASPAQSRSSDRTRDNRDRERDRTDRERERVPTPPPPRGFERSERRPSPIGDNRRGTSPEQRGRRLSPGDTRGHQHGHSPYPEDLEQPHQIPPPEHGRPPQDRYDRYADRNMPRGSEGRERYERAMERERMDPVQQEAYARGPIDERQERYGRDHYDRFQDLQPEPGKLVFTFP